MITKILLVDDNPDCRQVFRLYLRNLGYDLIKAKTGHEAVELAKTDRPDLMILDWGFPDYERLPGSCIAQAGFNNKRNSGRRSETAWAMDNIRTRTLREGAAACLVKPTAPNVLNDTI